MKLQDALRNARLLIVDDEPEIVELLTRILKAAGFRFVHSATDPLLAVPLYEAVRPDLVLLDIRMPGLDGFQVMDRLRTAEGASPDDFLSVLVLTAELDAETRLRALQGGAKDFLLKPFDRLEAVARVRNLLEVRLLHNLLREKHRELERSYRESERLLLNILPAPVAAALKSDGGYRPVLHPDASILFTDFKGFTRLAAALPPHRLVEELEGCFSAFDGVADRFHLEKLKTIGDSYMMAGGLPEPNRTHPVDCVRAGLAIRRLMEERNAAADRAGGCVWPVRIGIHTGPVMAGVIGRRKFAYDVWGDTVNTASRMESTGEPGRVNISGDTWARVKNFFVGEPRGRVEAKNKGPVDMHFVLGFRPELSAGGEGIEPADAFFEAYGRLREGAEEPAVCGIAG